MKTESTLYFDGQFWVGVIERHEADRVRAVRIVFGAAHVHIIGPTCGRVWARASTKWIGNHELDRL